MVFPSTSYGFLVFELTFFSVLVRYSLVSYNTALLGYSLVLCHLAYNLLASMVTCRCANACTNVCNFSLSNIMIILLPIVFSDEIDFCGML